MAKLSTFLCLFSIASVASALTVGEKRATGGYIQNPSGQASFTMYSGCGSPGKTARIARVSVISEQTFQRAGSLPLGSPLRSANWRSAQAQDLVLVMHADAALP